MYSFSFKIAHHGRTIKAAQRGRLIFSTHLQSLLQSHHSEFSLIDLHPLQHSRTLYPHPQRCSLGLSLRLPLSPSPSPRPPKVAQPRSPVRKATRPPTRPAVSGLTFWTTFKPTCMSSPFPLLVLPTYGVSKVRWRRVWRGGPRGKQVL